MTAPNIDQTQGLSGLRDEDAGRHIPRAPRMIASRASDYLVDNWLPITGLAFSLAMAVIAA